MLGGAEPYDLTARSIINAAGLKASHVARALGVAPDRVPTTHYAKGSYFTLTGGKPPFAHLVYPMPEPGGLGVHVTLDLGGRVRFGPDVEWIDKIDYHIDPERANRFYPAIRRYYPALSDGHLAPAYTGIRPKLSRDPRVESDFMIATEADHGVPGLVSLFGIESPGLTASPGSRRTRGSRPRHTRPIAEDAALFYAA